MYSVISAITQTFLSDINIFGSYRKHLPFNLVGFVLDFYLDQQRARRIPFFRRLSRHVKYSMSNVENVTRHKNDSIKFRIVLLFTFCGQKLCSEYIKGERAQYCERPFDMTSNILIGLLTDITILHDCI